MATYRLAAAIKNSLDDDFLVVKQERPPPLPEDEYKQFVDSDLWDLPSALLNPLEAGTRCDVAIDGADSVSDKLDLGALDVRSALDQVISQVSEGTTSIAQWILLKFVEEADFGPGHPVNTIFVLGALESKPANIQGSCRWISPESAVELLVGVRKSCDRLGPYVVIGLLHDYSKKWRASRSLRYQEFPPGVFLVPMKSRTAKPFSTTNIVVMVPQDTMPESEDSDYITYGEALIMDPGCCTQSHSELADLIASLPKKLVIFVTHHHYDHVDGLSVIQRCNPDAILMAHENTMRRISKEAWSRGYTSISGDEKICIGGQKLKALFAPGHTDGHLALLHVSTNSLIVGDHCVGHGSAVLDVRSGGNMKDYFLTTYKFMELSPNVLIPMHGRINLWPKRMLCGYLKHRRERELSILKAIENGAETLFDITSMAYADVDTKLWLHASSNVRIHVDHLAHQEKLPKDFSMKKFQATCHLQFLCQWAWTFVKGNRVGAIKVLAVLGISGLALSLAVKRKLG